MTKYQKCTYGYQIVHNGKYIIAEFVNEADAVAFLVVMRKKEPYLNLKMVPVNQEDFAWN